MQPVPLTDLLEFERQAEGVVLTCNHPELPVDGTNLVHRAATRFFEAIGGGGARIHLEKRLPLAAGIGGGSANAAVTLRALNELHDRPLGFERLTEISTGLGSDVPFFLQDGPALALGRGELVEPLAPFAALHGCGIVLVHPGFGVSTPWAYQTLASYPEARDGRPGRAAELIAARRGGSAAEACRLFYNSLEAPVLPKYPILQVFQEFFRHHGALGTLMSGSGSSTFAITADVPSAEAPARQFGERFGPSVWVATAAL